ncbi:MAG: 4-(cytidine 5'-diphospho)-2-C-methyl-D-erythritol kinase [Candidatus Omnitrophota bacterium]
MKLLSPAKVNLFLNVGPPRPDGYHDLTTLFERIDLCDEICLENLKKPGIEIRLSGIGRGLPSGPANLAYAAAKLVLDRLGPSGRRGIRITIKKRIPVRAGLGGGSSNAASVLLGLNSLWKIGFDRKTLIEMAGRLGSDVAFFVLEESFATGQGRGEVLRAIHGKNIKIWHCLIKPKFGIPTKESYATLDALIKARKLPKPSALTDPRHDARMLLRSYQNGDAGGLSRRLTNSLELALLKRDTKISELKNQLSGCGAMAALMSGSGSSVFGIFAKKHQAQKAARILMTKEPAAQIFVAGTY